MATVLGWVDLRQARQPLTFPCLKWLNLAQCTRLEKVFIVVPNLEYLNVNDCEKLTDKMLDYLVLTPIRLKKLECNGTRMLLDRRRSSEPQKIKDDYPVSFWEKQAVLGYARASIILVFSMQRVST